MTGIKPVGPLGPDLNSKITVFEFSQSPRPATLLVANPLTKASEAMGTKAKSADPCDSSWIEKTPGICGGEACIRNTRHTVSGLVQWRRLGLSDNRILEHHPDLTQADLDTAWSYFAEHTDEIEGAIKDDEET